MDTNHQPMSTHSLTLRVRAVGGTYNGTDDHGDVLDDLQREKLMWGIVVSHYSGFFRS